MGSGGTQVLLCALQRCSGTQWCWGLCDLSMVALLYFAIACPSLISSRPKDVVGFTVGCRVSFEKVVKQKNVSILEETLKERTWKALYSFLFKPTSSFLAVASNRAVSLVLGK